MMKSLKAVIYLHEKQTKRGQREKGRKIHTNKQMRIGSLNIEYKNRNQMTIGFNKMTI